MPKTIVTQQSVVATQITDVQMAYMLVLKGTPPVATLQVVESYVLRDTNGVAVLFKSVARDLSAAEQAEGWGSRIASAQSRLAAVEGI